LVVSQVVINGFSGFVVVVVVGAAVVVVVGAAVVVVVGAAVVVVVGAAVVVVVGAAVVVVVVGATVVVVVVVGVQGIVCVIEFVQIPVEVTVTCVAKSSTLTLFPANNSVLVAVEGVTLPMSAVRLKLGPRLAPDPVGRVNVILLAIFLFYYEMLYFYKGSVVVVVLHGIDVLLTLEPTGAVSRLFL
jgi:hypothetical protein